MDKVGNFQKKHRTDWQKILWDKFLDKISKAKSKEKVGLILDRFFSDYEKQNLTKRLAALSLIKEGKSYKEIGEILWLSPATISALKKNTLNNSSNYKSQRSFKTPRTTSPFKTPISRKSWLEEIFGDIDLLEFIKNPPRPRGIGITGAWDVQKYRRKIR